MESTTKGGRKKLLTTPMERAQFIPIAAEAACVVVKATVIPPVSSAQKRSITAGNSDRACDEMVDLEGFQDTRTEDDSTIPDSDRGTEKANEGAETALGDCQVE